MNPKFFPPIGWLVVVLANGAAVARASPLPEQPPVPSLSTALVSGAIQREASRLVRPGHDGVWRAHASGQSPTRTRLNRCTSTMKGALIGAGVGAVAGGGFAAYIENRLGEVRRAVVLQFAAGGAGVGALAGAAYCR